MPCNNKVCSLLQFPLYLCDPGPALSTLTAAESLSGPWLSHQHPQPSAATSMHVQQCLSSCKISRGFVGTLGEKSKGRSPNSASNSVRPFPCPLPCNCHKGATGASPMGDKMRICSLVLLSTLCHRAAHRSAMSVCWNLGVEPEPDRWVRGRMKTGRAWQRIQVPKLESQSRRRERL